jgi:hypothetical protein
VLSHFEATFHHEDTKEYEDHEALLNKDVLVFFRDFVTSIDEVITSR